MHPANVDFFKSLSQTQMMQVHYDKAEEEAAEVQSRRGAAAPPLI